MGVGPTNRNVGSRLGVGQAFFLLGLDLSVCFSFFKDTPLAPLERGI